jgi:hypothetical protein
MRPSVPTAWAARCALTNSNPLTRRRSWAPRKPLMPGRRLVRGSSEVIFERSGVVGSAPVSLSGEDRILVAEVGGK